MNIADKYQQQSQPSIGESYYPSQIQTENEQPVPQQPTTPPTPKKKVNWGVWAIVAVLVVILMAVTCPAQDDHRDAVAKVCHEYINSRIDDPENPFEMVGSFLANGVIDIGVKKMVTSEKYLIFSVGTLNKLDGTKVHVSFGVFGHVFTINKEQLEERLDGLE